LQNTGTVSEKIVTFYGGRGARTLVRFNQFILRTFQQNTSRYVTLSGGMCNLEVEDVCAQNLLHFTTFPSD
jgi:hypothetical protein